MSFCLSISFIFNLFIYYLFIFGCVGSSFLCEGFLQLWQAGATLHRGARSSHYRGLSCCGAQAPDTQAQQLWLTGPVAPRHVGSSQTRARTRVPCIGRQILNHCATREAPVYQFLMHDTYFKDWPLGILFQLLCNISNQKQYNLQCCDKACYTARFLSLAALDIWGWVILCCGKPALLTVG